MTYTYDLSTEIGQLRLLIKDTDVSGEADTAVFSDEELQFCLSQTGNIYLAAALALEINATDAARLAKRKRMDVLSSDTTEIAGQLRKSAQGYRQEAALHSEDNEPSGTSLLEINKIAADLLGLELTGKPPKTDVELARQWLPEV